MTHNKKDQKVDTLPSWAVQKIKKLEQELHDEQIKIQVQDIKIKQLEKDKIRAERQVQDQRRFKNALKLLFKAVDNVLEARIEHLSVAKRDSIKPNISGEQNFDTSSKQNLLRSMYKNDAAAYYSTRRRSKPQKFYAYRAVKGGYTFTKRAIGKSLKLATKALGKDRSNNEK